MSSQLRLGLIQTSWNAGQVNVTTSPTVALEVPDAEKSQVTGIAFCALLDDRRSNSVKIKVKKFVPKLFVRAKALPPNTMVVVKVGFDLCSLLLLC